MTPTPGPQLFARAAATSAGYLRANTAVRGREHRPLHLVAALVHGSAGHTAWLSVY